MLVHICCSVDSHYFLKRLKQDLPNEKLICYFYDPNIHPYSEFMLRYFDVKRSCDKLGIDLILGDYDYEAWLKGTKNLENEEERGKRCEYCFDFRIENVVKKALEIKEKKLTTTLLMSPKKSFSQLENSLKNAVFGTNLEIFCPNYRVGGGTNEQFELAKKDRLYHQNYCGCIFALKKQRDAKNLIATELMSEILGRVLPGSIEYRLELFQNIKDCEDRSVKFELLREKFLNYRLLFAYIKINKKNVPSHFLFYSHFVRNLVKFNIQENRKIYYNLKDDVILLDIEKFNQISGKNFKNVKEILKNPLTIEQELQIRDQICGKMSLNPIIILDEISIGNYEIGAKNELFYDNRQRLILNESFL